MSNDCIIVITSWEDAPSCWQNFTQSCDLYDRRKEINEGLKKYNAVITPQQKIYRKIIFNTPADRTMFILRWS